MNPDDMLSAAAASIGVVPAGSLTAGLQALEAEYQRRMGDDIARARDEALIDSLELEPAAYELAQQHEQQGNFRAAARWYGVAARGDHADAALRLGEILDLLAVRASRREGPSSYSDQRDELFLIKEAAQAYSEAYAAGHPEAGEKLDDMFAALEQRRARKVDGSQNASARSDRECTYVRNYSSAQSVLLDADITRLSHHAARCVPCLKALIARTIKDASAVPTGTVSFPNETDEEADDKLAGKSSPGVTALHFSGVSR
jgi:hypothetical protein